MDHRWRFRQQRVWPRLPSGRRRRGTNRRTARLPDWLPAFIVVISTHLQYVTSHPATSIVILISWLDVREMPLNSKQSVFGRRKLLTSEWPVRSELMLWWCASSQLQRSSSVQRIV